MNSQKLFAIFIIIFILFSSVTYCNDNIFLLTETRASNNQTVRLVGETFINEATSTPQSSSFSIIPGRKIIEVIPATDDNNILLELFTCSLFNSETPFQDDGIYYTRIDRFRNINKVQFLFTGPGWETVQIYPYVDTSSSLQQYVIFQKKETENLSLGRALVFAQDDSLFLLYPQSEIPMPFAPDIVRPFTEKGMWIATKSDLFGPPQFCIVDVPLKMSRPFLSNTFDYAYSVTDILTMQNEYLLVLAHGGNETVDRGNSKIFVIDIQKDTLITEPMSLFGEGNIKEKNIYPTNNGFWFKTTSFSEGFGYLTLATWNPIDGWEKKREYSFSGIGHSWDIAIHPAQNIVAVAYNNRLEIVGEPFNSTWIEKFDEPITYLNWLSDELLLVGSGGKLSRINITNRNVEEWFRTQSGFISYLYKLPAEQSEHSSEQPAENVVVEEMNFQSEHAGQDIQGLYLGKKHPAIMDWEVEFISEPVNWLLCYLNYYFDDTYLYLGLIPHSWENDIPSVWLRVSPVINQNLIDDTYPTPTTKYVRIHIEKSQKNPRKILFVWAQSLPDTFRSDKDPREIKRLVDMLSGAPYYFICEETSEPIENHILDRYGIVVIEAKAIANGRVSIKDLLNYTFQGGKLLILGDYWNEADPNLFNYWLTPIGIAYNPKQRFDGTLPVELNTDGTIDNTEISIVGGGTLQSIPENYQSPDPSVHKSVSKAKQLACISKNYGYGEIILLSARTPLTSKELSNNKNKIFTTALFRELAYSRPVFADVDGDGLSDTTEDRNQNGIVDAGETSPFIKDSDNDGIPDGDEDQNHNGIWDENETDPTCPDSDGDGIWDGADISPTPAIGQQIIARIDPAEAFAEGGSVVFIQGRNFTNDTQFLFGNRSAFSTRILTPQYAMVIAPEFHQDEGGKTFVYIRDKTTGKKIEPGKPFLYKPRNKVKISISDIPDISQPTDENITGKIIKRILITPPVKGNLQKVNILLRIIKGPPPDIKNENNKWNVKLTPIRNEWYLIVVEKNKTGPMTGPCSFDLISTVENVPNNKVNLYTPDIIKVWAETAYNGRLTVEVDNTD